MNSENPLNNEENSASMTKRNSKKRITILAGIVAAIICLVIIVTSITHRKSKREYYSLRAKYNSAVDLYNSNAVRYNLFLQQIKNENLTVEFNPIEKKDALETEYDIYIHGDPKLSELSSEIDIVTEQAEGIEVDLPTCALTVYNLAIENHNIIAEAYNDIVKTTSLDFIEDMPTSYRAKTVANSIADIGDTYNYSSIADIINTISSDTDSMIANYLLAEQITNPSEEWVEKRLSEIDDITGLQAVTFQKDPNGLLGKEGGYTACIYFTVKEIDITTIPGTDIVDKGTDAGGAVEVYDTLEHALARCDYLSQFDGTLLYSGSYAIMGTMVIRTSYQLDNKAQCDLTDQIAKVFTVVDVSR